MQFQINMPALQTAGQILNQQCHGAAVAGGWWNDPRSGERIQRNTGEMLMLVTSEVAEAMEGHRKNLMDDKLPHRKMFEVELADAVIRIFDLAGSQGFDLGTTIAEKIAFNMQRPDHKPEARLADGGKQY
jgi:NTP pyrophosphatase (non-canonical NTP hydrolase)